MSDITPELEQVARAMFDKRFSQLGYSTLPSWDHWRNIYVEVARAALMALREPTEGMYEAAGYRDPTETTWPQMIDYVLGVKHG